MPEELPKAFDPSQSEQKLYSLWEENGAFAPDLKSDKQPFTIIMPPPNANGSLHAGHALFVTLEDVMVRFHRMLGRPTLWLPGVDHAGFETQVVYQKKLDKEGRNWFTIPRQELYEEIKAFTLAHSANMDNQFKRLGASADWSRKKFTLDPDIIEIVYETFKQLQEDGLVYRDNKIVHWCSRHQTTLSDLEVAYEQRQDPFYYLKYGPFTIGTARPETKFGDKYVVMHPNDERYRQYSDGQKLEVDWINGKITATIIKDEAVDPEFGTGVMTITPWHDPVDFEIAKRHNLEYEQVIDHFGKLLPIAGELEGLHISKARTQIVEILKQKGLLEKIDEKYTHSVALCFKCKTVIEPQILPQWWLAMTKKSKRLGKSMQELGIEAVKEKQVSFVTKHFEKIYLHWLENIRDWNLSRQIVWGIQIPAWYCDCGQPTIATPSTQEITFMRHGQAEHNAKMIGNGDPSKPYHLTEKGIGQVKDRIEKLRKEGEQFDLIIASEMPRVQETAKLVAEAFGAEIITDPLLNDIQLGGLEGQSAENIRHKTNFLADSVDSSETMADLRVRLRKFFTEKYSELNTNKKILIVTSEAIFWALSAVLQNTQPINEPPLDSPHRVDNAQIRKYSLSNVIICQSCGKITNNRDKDVFDTWFSSGQWPFATLQTTNPGDFEKFYPTSVMESGHDIIFFWVARMIMLGKYKTGKVPFKDVYLHGLVRDKDRQKMSKSKGNVVDPLGIIDQYGTDALRMALVFSSAPGNDMALSEDKIRGMRNFANKVWNIGRFVITNVEGSTFSNEPITPKTDADKEILEKLDQTIVVANKNIENFAFHEAAQKIYDFIWHDLADTYLESSKKQLDSTDKLVTQAILRHTLIMSIKLLHPFMPFVTEALWQELFSRDIVENRMIITAAYPQLDFKKAGDK